MAADPSVDISCLAPVALLALLARTRLDRRSALWVSELFAFVARSRLSRQIVRN